MTSNTNNTGIMHARIDGRIVCGSRRPIMAVSVAEFRSDTKQCKRCAKKLGLTPGRNLAASGSAPGHSLAHAQSHSR